MRKGLRRNILLFLGALGDVTNELSYSTSYKRLLWRGYKPKSVYSAISRMLKAGELKKVMREGKPHFQLTTRGKIKITEEVPYFSLSQKPWDGYWRIVVFDIKEKNRVERRVLREKLKELGFGMWQRSVWITPHDVASEMNEFLEAKGLGKRCFCLTAKRTDMGNDRELARRVFKLSRLNSKYRRLLAWCEEVELDLEGGQASVGQIRRIWGEYKQLVMRDPALPSELLPSDWVGGEVHTLFPKIVKKRAQL